MPSLNDEKAAMSGSYRGVAGHSIRRGPRARRAWSATSCPQRRLDALPERILATRRDAVVEAVRRHIGPAALAHSVAGEIVANPQAGR